jgi:hypothetical protein
MDTAEVVKNLLPLPLVYTIDHSFTGGAIPAHWAGSTEFADKNMTERGALLPCNITVVYFNWFLYT